MKHDNGLFSKPSIWGTSNLDQVNEVLFDEVVRCHCSSVVDIFVIIYIKFFQASVHQKLFKSVHFWLSYSKHKCVKFFGPHCRCKHAHRGSYDDVILM